MERHRGREGGRGGRIKGGREEGLEISPADYALFLTSLMPRVMRGADLVDRPKIDLG